MEHRAPLLVPRRQKKARTSGTNTPVVMMSEAIQVISKMERMRREMRMPTATMTSVASRDRRNRVFSS